MSHYQPTGNRSTLNCISAIKLCYTVLLLTLSLFLRVLDGAESRGLEADEGDLCGLALVDDRRGLGKEEEDDDCEMAEGDRGPPPPFEPSNDVVDGKDKGIIRGPGAAMLPGTIEVKDTFLEMLLLLLAAVASAVDTTPLSASVTIIRRLPRSSASSTSQLLLCIYANH